MSRPAARIVDPVTCPAHGAAAIAGPCAPTVLVVSMAAARMTDTTMCPLGIAGVVIGGTTETLIEFLGATRVTEQAAHGGSIASGAPTVLIGKVLMARVVIAAGTSWDTPAGRAEIERQIREAERIQGIRIVTGPFEVSNDPSLLGIQEGPWNGTNNYGPGEVGAINALGAPGRPALIFTDQSTPAPGATNTADAITVSNAWAAPGDGLNNEGVIFGPNSANDPYVTSHELGHLLSGESGNNTHDTVNQNNVMWPFTGQRGDQWTDPWSSSAEQNPVLR
jgi:uncharacterized Zn-binding protein involved in type VI secretion